MTTITDDAFVRLFQERAGLDIDGWPGRDVLAKLDELMPPKRQPAPVGSSNAIPESYWPMLSKMESGDRPYIKAGTSSASGLYQFIRSTWIGEGGRWGNDMSKAFGGLMPSVEEQRRRAQSFTQKNADYLAKRGVNVNRASLYAAHFLGVVTACQVMAADVKAGAEKVAGEAATRANPSILKGKTVGEFYSWLHKKTGDWVR